MTKRMAATEFIEWAMSRTDAKRYELVAGQVVAMAPERAAHARVKAEAWLTFRTAIRASEVGCEAFVDGMAVRIDDSTVYEPDVLVRCGEPLSPDAVAVEDPVIVVEVLSPSSRSRDSGAKLEDYFRLDTVRHYLIVKTETRSVIHHWRDGSSLRTQIHTTGTLELDPPGISVSVADLFG